MPRVLETVRRVITLNELVKMMIPNDQNMATELLPLVDKQFRKNQRQTFASEGAFSGSRWSPLSPRYAAYKQRVKPGRKILAFSGRMRRSFTNNSNPEHATLYAKGGVMWFGTMVPYAKYHRGSYRGRPVRDPIRQTTKMVKTYSNVVRKWMVPRMRRIARAVQAQRRGM